MPTLVFEIEDGSQVVASLERRATIGSAEGNDIVAERADIAPHHAEVFAGDDNAWWVRDNNSTAGTFVNGVRVTARRLSPGDSLLFGSISARFSLEEDLPNGLVPAHRANHLMPVATDPEIEKKKLELAGLVEALARTRTEFEETVRNQESRIAALREESARLEPAVDAKRREISGLDAALAGAMAGLAKTTKEEQERIAALRAEAVNLEPVVEGRRRELSRLDTDLAQARTGFEKAGREQEAHLAVLRAEAAKLEPLIEGKRDELSKLDTDLAQARTGFEKAGKEQEAHLAVLRAEAAKLEPLIEGKRDELSKLEAGLAQARTGFEKAGKEQEAHLAALCAEAAKLEPLIEGKRDELSELEAGLTQARTGFEKAGKEQEAHLAVLRAEAAKLEPLIEGKRDELSELEAGLTQARTGFEKAGKEQEAHLATLRAEAAKLEPLVEVRRGELSKLDTGLALATAGFEKAVLEQDGHLVALREEAAKLEAVVGRRKQELKVLGSALANAQAEMEKVANVHESHVAELQKVASGLETDIDGKKNEITGLAGALQEAREIIDESRSLAIGLHENRAKHEDLAKSLAAAASRHEVISHQVRTLSAHQRTKLVEMERLEHDLKELESRRLASAGALENHEAGRRQVEESLKQAGLQSEQMVAGLAKLSGEKKRLADDVQRLGEQCGSLGLEISVLETRKSELRGVLDGLDRRHAEAVKKRTVAAEELTGVTARREQILAEIEEAAERRTRLHTEAGEIAAQIQTARGEVDSHTSARDKLIALNEKLRVEAAAAGQRLAELSGTGERLMQARVELQQTESSHHSLTNVLAELTKQHDATQTSALELEARIAGLKRAQERYEQEIPGLKKQHDEAQARLAKHEDVAAASRIALADEIERLRASASGEEARLGEILKRVGHAERHQAELEQQKRELEVTTKRLDEVQVKLRSVELEKNNMEARTQTLRQACSDTQLRLAELEGAEKSAALRVSRLASQETDLQKGIRQLGDEQQRERKRIEELRNLSDGAEREGVRQKERLAAGVVELHAEVARLEARLAHARTWNAELDQLYEKLGKMPDASPETREAWAEIQKRKRDIAEQLPSGIQVRPQSRPTVVPRGR